MSDTGAPLYLELMALDGERLPSAKFNQNMRIINNMLFASGSTLYTGLQAFWKLAEASGTRVDEWGSNDLTDNNTVTGAVGKIGNACQFTAANSEYLSIADNAALSMGDFDFSVAGWIYLDSLGANRSILSKCTASSEYEVFVTSGNVLAFFVSPDGTAFTQVTHATVLSASTWYHVCAWHDSVANTINISLNNGAAASAAHTTGVFNGALPFSLGARSTPALYWNGRLDAWGVWKKVLSASERTTLYNGGSGLETPFS